jgi:DNA-directed RNA polymerase specialized sigma24 family protein
MEPQDSSVSLWIKQLQAGDADLPTQRLWERYFKRLVGLARAKLSNVSHMADEEDVALSAFDSFCQGATRGRFPKLNDRGDLWRLLVTITARKACKQNRHDNRRKRGGNAVLDEAALNQEADAGAEMGLEQVLAREPTPAFAAQAAEEYQRLLDLLPDADMRDLALSKMEGFTNEEIATRLGCTVRSVERRLRLIRILWTQGEDG